MDERGLRGLLDQVKAGAMSRRVFLRRMAAVGLAAGVLPALSASRLRVVDALRRV